MAAGLADLTALELLDAYRRRDASPVEAVDAVADRIGDDELNAFTTLLLDEARVQARVAEVVWGRGEARALEGVPLAVKDLFDTASARTTYGSAMFAAHVPDADAAAVRRAREAGAVVVGKAATDEFAYGIAGVNPHFGATRNPWSPPHVSGGSSSGCAAALAAGQVPLALGTDTGGSIRVPSAFCGIVGFKGTWGTVATGGMWPMGRTIDHAGPMARTPADAALLQAVLAGELPSSPAGTRVGTCPGFAEAEPHVERAVTDAVAALEAAGCTAVEAGIEDVAGLVSTFVTIRDAETLHAHRAAGLFPDRRDEYGPLTAERLDAAVPVGLGDYLEASAARARHAAAFDRLFEAVDVLVLPISGGSPPEIEGAAPDADAWAMVHPFTVPFNLLGVPACAVRAGFDDDGLPIGVQVVGRHGGDRTVLELAQALFDATGPVQARRPDRPLRAAASSRASGT